MVVQRYRKKIMLQSNSKIFTNRLFGTSTDATANELAQKNLSTQEAYLSSSPTSNLGTIIPFVPSNQNIAQDTVGGVSSRISQTFIVTTVPNPTGSGRIFAIDGVNTPILSFVLNGYYIFNQSDATNIGHPLKFKTNNGSLYETGVKTSGTPGQIGAQTVIDIRYNAPSSLRYFCTVHGNGMGNTIVVIGGVSSGGGSSGGGSSGGGSSGGGSSGGGSSGGGYY